MPGLFRFQFRLKKITGNRELEFIYEIPEWEFYTVPQKSFNRPQKNLFSISFWDFYPVLSGLSVNITGNGEFKIQDNSWSAVKRITGYFPGKVSKAYITSCIDMELNRYILAAVDLEGGWKTLYSKNIIFSTSTAHLHLHKLKYSVSFLENKRVLEQKLILDFF